jgi:tripartite-type tricarboxylate transporter receptor subunit TctC
MFVLGDYLPHMSTGKLRLLAVSSTERSKFAPNVATFTEQGFKDVTSEESYGLFLPPGTPARIVDRIYDLAAGALRDPAVVEGMAKIGFEPALSGRAAYTDQLSRERKRWAIVVAESGFSIDE